jgi:hypothetical protein
LLLLVWWHPEEVWYGFAAQLLRLLCLDQWYVLLLATAAASCLLRQEYDRACRGLLSHNMCDAQPSQPQTEWILAYQAAGKRSMTKLQAVIHHC